MMLRYAITNRTLLPWSESGHFPALITLAGQWAARNLDYIQIREKNLAPGELYALTRNIVFAVREHSARTRILLNGPAEIALEAGADGVHLPASATPNAAAEACALFARSGRDATVSHACHSIEEILRVREEWQRAPHAATASTLILYAPVFEKVIAAQGSGDRPGEKIPGRGLDALRAATRAAGDIPVFALGGVTEENAPACLAAGAAGIAGIRMFLEERCP